MTIERGSSEAVETGSSAEVADAMREKSGVFWWVLRALWQLLAVLASPKLTVVCVLAAIGIVMVGTLAQVRMDIWEVVESYFKAKLCWVDLKVLFPVSFFPWAAHIDWETLPIRRFPFPGGASIGLALAVNLAAAAVVRAVRFGTRMARSQAKPPVARLLGGLLALAAGFAITWWVIDAGHNRDGLQGEPFLQWSTLWLLIRIGLFVLWGASLFGFVRVLRAGYRNRPVESGILGACLVTLSLVLAWVFVKGDSAVLNNSSLRILYQLIQGEIAALVLLGACLLLFGNRAGNVLLHGGVALLMFGEFYVSRYAEEQQMTLVEGQTVSFTRDTRSVDLAITPLSGSGRTAVSAIPTEVNGKLTEYARGVPVDVESLPFDVKIVEYFKNSSLQAAEPDGSSLATAGLGMQVVVKEIPPKSGVQSGQPDVAAAYVKLTSKVGGADIGTYLVSQHFRKGANRVSLDGNDYDLDLQYKHLYKPYHITLLDVRKDDYTGTAMARNYSSRIRLQDPSRNVDFETKIWMNNPLRYAGETFYQSGYNEGRNGQEVSTLQVVKNTGWMIPYVSCMIVATGMLVHFLLILLRFLKQPRSGSQESLLSRPPTQARPRRRAEVLVPLAVVLFFGLWITGKALPPRSSDHAMKLERFGSLPLMYEGRIKPFDTLARNSLRIISGRQTYTDAVGNKQPAIRWLLNVIANPEAAGQHRVFRIESAELQEAFGLERRKGSRYSWNELASQPAEFNKLAVQAGQQEPSQRTFLQRKAIEFTQRVNCYQVLTKAFRPALPPLPPSPEQLRQDPEAAAQATALIRQFVNDLPKTNRDLESMRLPLATPAGPEDQPWQVYVVARNNAYAAEFLKTGNPDPATTKLAGIFDAYRQGDVEAFNQALDDYETFLAENRPAGWNPRITRFEAYFNHFAPFYNAIPLYFAAFLLTLFAWLLAAAPRWSTILRSSAFWLIVLTFAIHTFALGARVVISGRPPVTNLYSSAVFIGWGCVAIGLLMEIIFRIGVGNLVSAVAGIGTLVIAHILAADGDTIKVLQAVLDTQFWLTVHVLTITLGYSAMFLAGLLGLTSIVFVLGKTVGWRFASAKRRRLPSDLVIPSSTERMLDSMIYGSICFAAFFSLVGTVLGGLWADDSWGRFWGWDPKENGALIIVLWTALVLHARSARLVKQRGMAILAVGGNIVTAWSWFGVNELGVGLHAYGFTEGVAATLLLFWLSQLLVIGLALLQGQAARIAQRSASAAVFEKGHG